MKLYSLKTRLTVVNTTILIIASIAIVFFINFFEKQKAFKAAEEKSTILIKHNLAIHSYINTKLKPTLFALTDTIRESEYFDPTWMSSTYAVRDIDKLYRQNSEGGYYYKEAAINARSPENEADDFERDFILKLNKDKNVNKISGVRDFDGKPYFFTLIRGESMEKGCLRCHSTPDKAPANLVKTYGDARSFNRSIDEAVSAISIRMPLEQPYREANVLSAKLSGMMIVLLIVTFSLQIRFINQMVLTPLKRFKTETESIASNPDNLGLNLQPFENKEMDEIATSFNNMSAKLKDVVDNLDITVRERTADLTESEAKYRLLFENMSNGFALHEMIYDTHGNPSDYRFIEVNRAFEELTGLNASDIVGRTILDIMPNTEKHWIETYGKVTAQGVSISFDNFSQELGRHFQVWAFCPKPGFFATSISDITEQKQIEYELKMSEERFRLILETVAVVPWEFNIPENRWVYVGSQVTDLLGYAPEEWTTLEWWLEIIHPEDRTWVPTYCADLTSRGEEHSMEYRLLAKDGSFVWVNDLVTVEMLDGKPHIMRGVIVDINNRKKAEEEKHELEQQFQQAQKLESLGVLAGGIAHDFNNILAIIMGYCGLTKMNYEDAGKHIPEIEKAAERAAALCRQMLAYAGKASLSQSQVNTWILVDEMVTMLKTTIQKNVEIKNHLGADLPTITGDISQLRQVVMNLIINAAEAIGDAEGVIDVKLAKAEIKAERPEQDHLGFIIPAGRYICFEVTDNGCGMDDETRRKIFEPFYTTKFTGRGLGMSAVLGIIKAHDGALQLKSRLGHGTTFRVYLPVQPSKSETGEAQQITGSAPWQGCGTILLAEDEEQVKEITIAMLQMLGFTVIDAANGKEALELYQQNAADIILVITDMGMPVMNGYELFYKLKQLDPQLPIIISSGFGVGDIVSKIPSGAIAGMINKPYNFEQLRDVLQCVVEGAKSSNA